MRMQLIPDSQEGEATGYNYRHSTKSGHSPFIVIDHTALYSLLQVLLNQLCSYSAFIVALNPLYFTPISLLMKLSAPASANILRISQR